MAVPLTHYLHSRNGCIGAGTDHGPAEVDAIIAALRASGRRRLVLHFHGGLVPKAAGLDIAQRLLDADVYAGAYPVFFVWESGALEAVRNNAGEIAAEPIFQELVRKVLEYALARTGMQDGTRSLKGSQVDPVEVKAQVRAWFANPQGKPPLYGNGRAFADGAARAAAGMIDENEIQLDLEADTDFLRALHSLADVPAGVRSAMVTAGVAPASTKMDAAVLAEIAPPAAGARGLVSMARVAWYVAKILAKVVWRILNSRDHGFHATVVEEVLRALYGDVIGKTFFWDRMKQDTLDAFGGNPQLHAGTALLHRLKDAMNQGLALERIYLVGHSTGGIYISHLLDAVDAMGFPAQTQFDVVLLAPANTHRLWAWTVSHRGERIRWMRMFGMNDDVERADGLLGDDWRRALYPSSLLYFVSGLLEYETDAPLLGMRRFLDLPQVFTAPAYPESDQLRGWLGTPSDRMVWSLADGGNGLQSHSRKHGDFDNDLSTLDSLRWIVSH